MKKCPECGNPSYDGAPVCGNCGYKFPKPKVKAPVQEDIFEDRPIINKSENEESTLEIIKKNKVLIGAILLITIIVIGIIIVTGPSNHTATDGSNKYSDGKMSFSYPSNWKEVNGSDLIHTGAVFFEGNNGTTIEYYNVTSDYSSIYGINSLRISSAQDENDYINTIQPIQIDGKNVSNVIVETSNGTFTRYVSILSNDTLYVFKINGKTIDDTRSSEIESVLNSVHIA